MKKVASIILFIVLIAAMTACQPTPGSEAVVNKGGGLEDKILSAAHGTAYGSRHAGDRIVWSETRSVDVDIEGMGEYTVTVNIDAALPEIPEKVPAYIIEPEELSEDFMKKAAVYLLKGEIFDGKESKEDVEKERMDFKKDISTHTIIDGYQENIDDYLKWLDKRYNNAAETNGEARFEYTQRDDGTKWFSLKSYPDGGGIMEFSSFCDTSGFYFRINEPNRTFRYISDIPGEDVQANGVSYEEAKFIADKGMTDLFEEPFAIAHEGVTDIINDNEYLWNDGRETSLGQAYVFYYTREYGGIPSLFIKSAPSWSTDDTEYAKPYGREGACVVVDGRGISQMWYESRSGTVKTLNDNVALMPFGEVLDKFKDSVFYHSLWGLEGSSIDINITGIEFGMVREPLKDNPDRFMMVPAWNFTGDLGNTVWDESDCVQGKSILALSAIDGSIITRYDEMTDPK